MGSMMNEFEQFCIDWCFDIDDPVARKKFDARIANKERQKIYRKNHRDTKAHINLLIDRETKAIFDNIVNHYGVTKVQFLKSMLEKEEKKLFESFDEKQLDQYLGIDDD
jgi:hypothetical protein